ncbi:MAG: hypothetical protein JNL82_06570 [Myxococcales bacterium]|nr:hypothetical protein [Myxococcales bacterium]
MHPDDDPRILEHESVVAFGPTSALGRRAPGPFTVDGVAYCCLEQYAAADKALALADAAARADILACSSPAEHAALARRLGDDPRTRDERCDAFSQPSHASAPAVQYTLHHGLHTSASS